MQIIIACFNVSKIAKLCLANYIESRTYLSTDKPQTEIYLIEKNLWIIHMKTGSYFIPCFSVTCLFSYLSKWGRIFRFSPYLLMAFLRYCWSHLVLGLMQTSRSLFLSLALRTKERERVSDWGKDGDREIERTFMWFLEKWGSVFFPQYPHHSDMALSDDVHCFSLVFISCCIMPCLHSKACICKAILIWFILRKLGWREILIMHYIFVTFLLKTLMTSFSEVCFCKWLKKKHWQSSEFIVLYQNAELHVCKIRVWPSPCSVVRCGMLGHFFQVGARKRGMFL